MILLLFPLPLHAGYYELGFAGTYRKLHLPSETRNDSFDSTVSYTASLAYYFAEMAALEVNYTKGQSERFIPSSTVDSRTTFDFSLIGMDLILTFAERTAPFVPYIKAGVAFITEKKVTYQFTDHTNPSASGGDTVPFDSVYVPSVGFGLKTRLTETISFKIGLEAWTSDKLGTNEHWDMAGRAGISWFF